SQRCFDYSTGRRTERDPDPEYLEQIAEQRASLIEGIIQESEDETLMDRYLSGEDIDVKALIGDLETAVARGSFYPVLATSVPHGDHPGPVIGMLELLEIITQAFPSPLEHGIPPVTPVNGGPPREVSCDPAGPLVAEVIKRSEEHTSELQSREN